MKQEDRPNPKRRILKRSDNAIPDYEHLFNGDEETKTNKKSGFFKKILKTNRKSIIAGSFLYLLQAAPLWFLPLLTANIINLVTDTLNSQAGITSQFWQSIAINTILILILLAQNVPTTIFRVKMISNNVRRTSAGVKSAVIRKLQSLSITYHKDIQTGKVQAKFLKDTEAIDGLLFNVQQGIIPAVIGIIVVMGISVVKSGAVALFFLIIVPCNVLLTRVFMGKVYRAQRDCRIKTENLSSKMNTMLEMISVTKSHGLEKTEINSFKKTIDDQMYSGIFLDRIVANFGSWAWVIPNFMSVVCLIFCSILAIQGYIGVGDIVMFQTMFSQVTSSVSTLVNQIPTLSLGAESLSSISEILNSTDIELNIGKTDVPSIEGRVEFKNLYYRYPNTDQYVVSDLNLKVESGECIAVVGASGSGKSTVMNLIIGFLMPTEGDLLIDGKSIKELNLSRYRHNISVVPQNSILFAGSIRENITYGLDRYTEEDLERVIEMANLKDFIAELPEGLDTNVGEHGGRLSGGQKQRITIARALIRNPRILILDEATSALDNISEYHVQKAISASIKGRTTFIVAHRLSTIRNADRIVVMEQGRAVEIGTYEELMEKKGKFYELKELNDMNLKEAEDALS